MSTSPKLLLSLSAWLLLAPSLPLSAAAFSTNAFSDAFVTPGPSGNLSGNNFGAAGAVGVAAPGLAKGEFQSALQFDLAGARHSFDNEFGAGQWSLQSIQLQLTTAPNNNAIFNNIASGLFQIFWMQNDGWVEGAGTPNAPGTSGITFSSLQGTVIGPGDESVGTFNYDGAATGVSTYNLNLTPGLMGDIMAGDDVSLRVAAADSSVSYLFNSRNFGTAGSRPAFTVTAVPEPSALILGGAGLTLLLARNWTTRRRNL